MKHPYASMESYLDEEADHSEPEIVVASNSSSSILDLSDDISLSVSPTNGIKTIRLLSWNTFSIPFANPHFLSNPKRCCQWLETVLNEIGVLLDHNHNELVLCCFQELWAFKVGILPKFMFNVLKYVECLPVVGYLVVILSVFFATLQALIISLIINITRCYNPKEIVIEYFRQYFGDSIQFPFIPWFQLMDNGLLILCNHSPNSTGFQSYSTYHGEDGLVSKGFIWCFFEDLDLLVINTHLQASGNIDIRLSQLNEIKIFLREKRDSFAHRRIKVLLCGDFNIDMTSFDNKGSDFDNNESDILSVDENHHLSHVRETNAVDIGQYLSLQKISTFQPTFPSEKWNIDHVFSDLDVLSKTCRLFECESSDHCALYMKINIY